MIAGSIQMFSLRVFITVRLTNIIEHHIRPRLLVGAVEVHYSPKYYESKLLSRDYKCGPEERVGSTIYLTTQARMLHRDGEPMFLSTQHVAIGK